MIVLFWPDHMFNDDPTIPPPGKRTGTGISSIFPFLVKSLATKPQVPTHPDYASTVPQSEPAPMTRNAGDFVPRPKRRREDE